MNRTGILLSLVCLATGCSKVEQPFTKSTIKVKGQITINGAAPADLKIQLEARPTGGADTEHPSVSFAETAEDGTFEFSTYAPADGVPEGKYVILAKSQSMSSAMSNGVEGADKLGGKYDKVEESPKNFEATAGSEPIDLGTIDLKATLKKK